MCSVHVQCYRQHDLDAKYLWTQGDRTIFTAGSQGLLPGLTNKIYGVIMAYLFITEQDPDC